MSIITNTEAWSLFFECYRNLPELWQLKGDIYKDKNKKKIAWAKLLETYQLIEKDANIVSLKRRVNNIRTCFRRELKKVEESLRSGVDIYVPTLWYYEKLMFLRDQEVQIRGSCTLQLGEELTDAEVVSDTAESCFASPSPRNSGNKRRKIADMHITERPQLIKEELGHLQLKERDDAAVYSEGWAASYRKLSPMQQLYARKAIEEIFVLGQLDLLTLETAISRSTSGAASTSSSSMLDNQC